MPFATVLIQMTIISWVVIYLDSIVMLFPDITLIAVGQSDILEL